MDLIVSTCGTSTLTNLADGVTRKLVVEHANAFDDEQIPIDASKALRQLIDQARMTLSAADVTSSRHASAELHGILCLAGHRTPLPSSDVHILLHTDTWLGTAAAEIVADKLRAYGVAPHMERVKSLSTQSRELFDDGLRNLVQWAANTLPGYRQSRYRVIFNLVGGFKSMQGFMQTLGMFHADEIVYVFESGDELLRIPRLPVDLDAAARQVMTRNASVFRRLDTLGPQPTANINSRDIPESLLYTFDDETELSPWGKLLWSAFQSQLYRQSLLSSPSARLHYTDAFQNDARGLSPERLRILNERMDDMLRFLESPDHPNPRRLDVKSLRGNPKPPSTHEADAWADADCRRIFLHFESDVIVLDGLAAALH